MNQYAKRECKFNMQLERLIEEAELLRKEHPGCREGKDKTYGAEEEIGGVNNWTYKALRLKREMLNIQHSIFNAQVGFEVGSVDEFSAFFVRDKSLDFEVFILFATIAISSSVSW